MEVVISRWLDNSGLSCSKSVRSDLSRVKMTARRVVVKSQTIKLLVVTVSQRDVTPVSDPVSLRALGFEGSDEGGTKTHLL